MYSTESSSLAESSIYWGEKTSGRKMCGKAENWGVGEIKDSSRRSLGKGGLRRLKVGGPHGGCGKRLKLVE